MEGCEVVPEILFLDPILPLRIRRTNIATRDPYNESQCLIYQAGYLFTIAKIASHSTGGTRKL